MSAAHPPLPSESARSRLGIALRKIRRERGRLVHDLAQQCIGFLELRGEMRETDIATSLAVEADLPFESQKFVQTALQALRNEDVLEWRGHGRLRLTEWAEGSLDPARETW